MEVGQGPNWGCSAKGKKNIVFTFHSKSTCTTCKCNINVRGSDYRCRVTHVKYDDFETYYDMKPESRNSEVRIDVHC
jgi:hypothetical protein